VEDGGTGLFNDPGGLQREFANLFAPPPFFRLRGSGLPPPENPFNNDQTENS